MPTRKYVHIVAGMAALSAATTWLQLRSHGAHTLVARQVSAHGSGYAALDPRGQDPGSGITYWHYGYEDAYITVGSPEGHGTDERLILGRDQGDDRAQRRTLLRVNVAALEPDAMIQSVSLRLFNHYSLGTRRMRVDVYELYCGDWDPSIVSWSQCSGDGASRGRFLGSATDDFDAMNTLDISLSDVVRGPWSLLLIGYPDGSSEDDDQPLERRYCSFEGSDRQVAGRCEDYDSRPHLVIKYTRPAYSTPTPTSTQTPEVHMSLRWTSDAREDSRVYRPMDVSIVAFPGINPRTLTGELRNVHVDLSAVSYGAGGTAQDVCVGPIATCRQGVSVTAGAIVERLDGTPVAPFKTEQVVWFNGATPPLPAIETATVLATRPSTLTPTPSPWHPITGSATSTSTPHATPSRRATGTQSTPTASPQPTQTEEPADFQGTILFHRGLAEDQWHDIYRSLADGTAMKRLTDGTENNTNARYSPDLSLIVYSCQSIGQVTHVCLMNFDGSNVRRLWRCGAACAPDWSPDGRQIVYECEGGGVCVSERDGSRQRPLSTDPSDGFPRWSRDGTRIAFSSNNDIWVMRSDGSDRKNLTNSSAWEWTPAWSPDDSLIAFVRTTISFQDQIQIMDPDEPDIEAIPVSGKDGNLNPVFSPDGTSILVANTRTTDVQHRQLARFDVTGGDYRSITRSGDNRPSDWAPPVFFHSSVAHALPSRSLDAAQNLSDAAPSGHVLVEAKALAYVCRLTWVDECSDSDRILLATDTLTWWLPSELGLKRVYLPRVRR